MTNSTHTQLSVDDVASYLAGWSLRFGTEELLQEDVAAALAASAWRCEREFVLTKSSRVDFYLPDLQIGIECKVGSSMAQVTRQIVRYANHDSIAALILISRKCSHSLTTETVCGKPFRFVWVGDNQL